MCYSIAHRIIELKKNQRPAMFNKKYKKIAHGIWAIVGIIVILGMVLLYVPLFF